MSGLDFSPGTLTAVVVALGFAAGLNVYATVLALGTMARLHWVVLPSGLEMLADPWVIGVSGVLFAVEFVADKVPGLDLVWNALHTFVRIPVAALLAYGAASHLSPGMHLLVTCVGATIAAVAHGSKTAARVAVTPSPEPVSNIALSTAEDGVAIGLTWVALHHPWVGSGVVVGLIAITVGVAWWGARRLRSGWQGTQGEMGSVTRRLQCAGWAAAAMGCGLAVRMAPLGLPWGVAKYGGSALWAATIYWVIATVVPGLNSVRVGCMASLIAMAVEFGKMYRSPGMDAFRLTLAGKLLLGRYFAWWDILAYLAGIWVAVAMDRWWVRGQSKA